MLQEDDIHIEDVNGDDGSQRDSKNWPADLRMVLQILHAKVANKIIPSVPFMAEIIANDGSLSGNVDSAVFSRIIAKIGIVKVGQLVADLLFLLLRMHFLASCLTAAVHMPWVLCYLPPVSSADAFSDVVLALKFRNRSMRVCCSVNSRLTRAKSTTGT